jgi:transcriptional regulator with XRE-family HTH domain
MVTSKKIAEMAGVSRGTVDRALNNRKDVNPVTRQKILEIAKLLKYKPNKAGKILVSHQKKIKIGCVIMENMANMFVVDLYKGIMLKAHEYSFYGIEVIVEKVGFQSAFQCAAIDKLIAKGVNALVIQPVNEPLAVLDIGEETELGFEGAGHQAEHGGQEFSAPPFKEFPDVGYHGGKGRVILFRPPPFVAPEGLFTGRWRACGDEFDGIFFPLIAA